MRAALVDEPMAQLHESAMPIWKFFSLAYRPVARAQGLVIVNALIQMMISDRHFSYARFAYEDALISR
jgi:hypothetical protein